MTDLEMLKHLLKKCGRMFDEAIEEDGSVIIQIHVSDIRYEWDFDKTGNLKDEWENRSPTSWLTF